MAATTTEAPAASETDPTPSASMSPKLMIGLVLLLVLISNGTWAAVFFLSRDASGAAPAQAAEAAPAPIEAPGPLVELEPLVVNLADGNGSRYLRVGISVELGTPEHEELFAARRVPLRDALLSHMSGLRAREVLGREDKERLRGELLELARGAVSERAIQRVYFTEFMMQ